MRKTTISKAVATLIKDAALIAITFGLVGSVLGISASGSMINIITTAMFFGGIPFGWRWASKIITAVSLQGILLKLAISFFLGWIAVWVVVGGDVISLIAAIVSARKEIKTA